MLRDRPKISTDLDLWSVSFFLKTVEIMFAFCAFHHELLFVGKNFQIPKLRLSLDQGWI